MKKLILALFLLATIACKKEKQPEPYPTFEKLYVLKYEAKIQGYNVTGKISYLDPQQNKIITENIGSSNKIVKIFTIKKGQYLYATCDAFTDMYNAAVSDVNIYVSDSILFSGTNSSVISSHAHADGTFN